MNSKKTPRRTILDISQWKPGDVAYVVTHRIPQLPAIKPDDIWTVDGTVHPKTAYDRGILVSLLGRQTPLPKMHAIEFDWIMSLLHSKLIVAEYNITSVERCRHTGECQYLNNGNEIMPESCLFRTRQEAEMERTRIMDLFRRWACDEPAY